MPDTYTQMAEVIETVRRVRERGKSCGLLVGAGCSVEAGIPTAAGFVEIIAKNYSTRIRDLSDHEKTYPKCMAALAAEERRDLIADVVDNARLNWAHIAIAQLVLDGWVDRVLTTNFDPLIVRACSLLGVHPAVYDLAASSTFDAGMIASPAIIYLHGQRSGFVLLNTVPALNAHSRRLAPVFDEAMRNRVWLVVGYSGENDPVFEQLAAHAPFGNPVYWVGHKDAEPATQVRARILADGKYGFFVQGYNADQFFAELATHLDCFPPPFAGKPFSHLDKLLAPIPPYKLSSETESVDIISSCRELIGRAIAQYEASETADATSLVLAAQALLMAGDSETILGLPVVLENRVPPEMVDTVAIAYIMQGDELRSRASAAAGDEADQLYALIGGAYHAALAIKPDMHEALNNWGLTLFDHAKTKAGDEADRLFALAGEKFQAALAIKPNKYVALNNWGNALSDQARTKTGVEADQLFARAAEKFEAALATKLDVHEALYNWALTLVDQAKTKTGDEADLLFTLAGEKYRAALASKPGMHEALNNWGIMLAHQAQTKTGDEADRLFTLATAKYRAALAIKPDKHESLNNWGVALARQAKTKTGDEADLLFTFATAKYQAALAIKPDKHESLYNWALVLSEQALARTGDEADLLFTLAGEKYQAALAIKHDKHKALSNWGIALARQAKTKTGYEADRLYALAGEKFAAALAVEPNSDDALNGWGIVLSDQAKTKTGYSADRLYALAGEKYEAALIIDPIRPLYNMACLAALAGSPKRCHELLEAAAAAAALPSKAHLASDTDLDSVRDEPWFPNIVVAAN